MSDIIGTMVFLDVLEEEARRNGPDSVEAKILAVLEENDMVMKREDGSYAILKNVRVVSASDDQIIKEWKGTAE